MTLKSSIMIEEDIKKKKWARRILMQEACLMSKRGTSAKDFLDIINNRTEELTPEGFLAQTIIPDEIIHIIELVWNPL